jgi:hypothetical protein
MDRSLIFLVTLALSSSAVAGCGADPKSSSSNAKTVEPTSETRAFMTAAADYETWENFPEQTAPKLSAGHGNMYVLAYYNQQVDASEQSGTLPLVDGSMIVKENFKAASDSQPESLTVMAKKNGRWYWYEQDLDAKILAPSGGEGLQGYDLSACAGCHETKEANDYVFTHVFAAGAAGAGAGGAGAGGAGGAGP